MAPPASVGVARRLSDCSSRQGCCLPGLCRQRLDQRLPLRAHVPRASASLPRYGGCEGILAELWPDGSQTTAAVVNLDDLQRPAELSARLERLRPTAIGLEIP